MTVPPIPGVITPDDGPAPPSTPEEPPPPPPRPPDADLGDEALDGLDASTDQGDPLAEHRLRRAEVVALIAIARQLDRIADAIIAGNTAPLEPLPPPTTPSTPPDSPP